MSGLSSKPLAILTNAHLFKCLIYLKKNPADIKSVKHDLVTKQYKLHTPKKDQNYCQQNTFQLTGLNRIVHDNFHLHLATQ